MEIPGGLEVVELPSGNFTVRIVDTRPEPPVPTQSDGVRWYVPYTVVHPQVVAAAPESAVWVDLSGSPFSYFGALYSWWKTGETFAVLEHDVVCRPEVVDSFESCPEPWCVYAYTFCHWECREGWRNMLGCTRFRSELMAAVPDAVSSIPPDERDWHNLCDGLGNNLRNAGFTHHWHHPPVDHHPWTDVHP